MNILLSRTDSIGDVVLTIPMAGYLKLKFPECKVFFLGKTYTKAIVESSSFVDEFVNWDDFAMNPEKKQVQLLKSLNIDWLIHVFPNKSIARLAKKAGVKNRIGTSHRTFHWLTCNKLLNFSRKKSDLHESQLNFKLLSPMGINEIPELESVSNFYGISTDRNPDSELPIKADSKRINVILHPKSKGSAREWGLDNFGKLIELLPQDKFKIFVSGTKEDKFQMESWMNTYSDKIEDITGKLSLEQFIDIIGTVDALVAASTGPLHIAAALGKKAIGIYPPIKPMHPGRWQPIGINAKVLVENKICNDCRKSTDCACMKAILPQEVVKLLT